MKKEDEVKWQTRDEMPQPTNPLQALRESYCRRPDDIGVNKFDAWLYGIIVGWDDPSYKELAPKHNWSVEEIEYNKLLHKNYMTAWNLIYLKIYENNLQTNHEIPAR